MTNFTLTELQDIQASLKLGKRDNLSPVLAALALLSVGVLHHHDWTDLACILWGTGMIAYFARRHVRDRAVHTRAKAIIEMKRLGPTQ